MMYVCVCSSKLPEQVREVIELAGQYIIIPYSNSQAHRIADKYQCTIFYVEDINALKELIEKMKRFINRKYEIIEINDIRWYPSVVEYAESLLNNDYYIEYYSTEGSDGYYAEHKRSNTKINVTNPPF